VTSPLYLVAAGALDGVGPGSLVTLDGAEGRHAATVRRARAGEPIDVADGAGTVVRGSVDAVGRDTVTVRVAAMDHAPLPSPRLVLVQALAKGGRDELAVQTATELGVDAVVPWQASRCVVVWAGERGERSRRRWEDTVRAAAKQSRRPWLPPVGPVLSTASLAARVSAAVAAGGAGLVLHEDAEAALTGVTLPGPWSPKAGSTGPTGSTSPEVLIVVGPEGGISDPELEQLTAAGGRAVRLGPQVLRSSSAGAAALAVLSARLGRWA
jgi:16S rRNA (uracil1498-N3)-methyltransferase